MTRALRPDEVTDLQQHQTGLRAIATFEALKGALVLAGGLGILALLGRDIPEVAERLILWAHLNPESHLSHVFLRAADRVTDARLWAAAAGAAAYSIVRFVEAWGLWHAREWAEWFALLSGCLYLPWEIYEVVARPTPVHWLLLIGNVLIVLYVAWIRLRPANRVAT